MTRAPRHEKSFMAAANHFSSKHLRMGGLVFNLLLLAGCAQQGGLLGEGLRLTTFTTSPEVVVQPVAAVQQLPLKATVIADQQTEVVVKKTEVVITPASDQQKLPAWCEYLKEDSAAQAAIMRSPSISGNLSNDGKAGLSVGVSLTSIAKANLLENSAEVRCRRYMAETGLQKLVFLSPQGLTSAGFKAKASSILSQQKEIKALRRKIAAAMVNGDMDRERATILSGLADQLLVDANTAKSQADRRTGDLLGAKDQASVLGSELLRAEADMEDVNSRLRTYDAIDISVSAGWNDDLSTGGLDVTDEGFSGKVSFSMKLGAGLPSRFNHEERAKQAKLRAIKSEEGGALWQVGVLRLAHERAIEGLEESKAKLDDALKDANRLLAALNGVENPTFQATYISARLQIIKLKSDKAAISSSLDEIRSNLKRLKVS